MKESPNHQLRVLQQLLLLVLRRSCSCNSCWVIFFLNFRKIRPNLAPAKFLVRFPDSVDSSKDAVQCAG